jgi:hypothetical protein
MLQTFVETCFHHVRIYWTLSNKKLWILWSLLSLKLLEINNLFLWIIYTITDFDWIEFLRQNFKVSYRIHIYSSSPQFSLALPPHSVEQKKTRVYCLKHEIVKTWENKTDFFSNLYCDFTQLNYRYTEIMPQGSKCIYNLKNNENWRWNHWQLSRWITDRAEASYRIVSYLMIYLRTNVSCLVPVDPKLRPSNRTLHTDFTSLYAVQKHGFSWSCIFPHRISGPYQFCTPSFYFTFWKQDHTQSS